MYSGRGTNATLYELLPGVPYRLRLILRDHIGDVSPRGVNRTTNHTALATAVDVNVTLADSWGCGNSADLTRFR